jgi:hypothetical protein
LSKSLEKKRIAARRLAAQRAAEARAPLPTALAPEVEIDRVEPAPPPRQDRYRVAAIVTAACLMMLLLRAAYFSDRNGGVDEIGLYNPTYMAVHTAQMTYPVHGYLYNMVVHPPVHYEMVALMMKMGLTLYYAQSTPALLMLMLFIAVVMTSPFPGAVRVGLLYGIWVSIAIFSKASVEMFGMRPENHLGAAWLTGLILLESARLDGWDLKRMFAGGFLLAYASSVHYYAGIGILGAAVYAVWAPVSLGLQKAWKPVAAIFLGGLIFGIPYLLIYFLPNYEAIQTMVRSTQSGGSILENLATHRQEYFSRVSQGMGNFWLTPPLRLGIPLVLLSTPILYVIRSTRGLALAALPMQLFVLLFAWHKHAYYYIHEIALYSAAIAAAMLILADGLMQKLSSRWARAGVGAVMAFFLCLGWWQLDKWGGASISWEPRVHEQEIARAAGREMLGPRARVGSRIGIWYASGGHYWYGLKGILEHSLFAPVTPAGYFSNFDAVAEHSHMSESTLNPDRKGLLSWYLDGTLRLRGFFFAQVNHDLRYLLFATARPNSLTGYGMKGGQLFRFDENAQGSYELAIIDSPTTAAVDSDYEAEFHSVMDIPKAAERDRQRTLVSAIIRADHMPAYLAHFPEGRLVEQVRGSLTPVDWRSMVAKLRREDLPMRFYAGIEQGPPPDDAVRLDRVVELSGFDAMNQETVVKAGSTVTVDTPKGMGAFGATVPIRDLDLDIPGWIQIRARGVKGTSQFGVLTKKTGQYLNNPIQLDRTPEAVELNIALRSVRKADELMIRNATGRIRSEVQLQSVALWIRKQDWEKHREQLSALK